ncbi:hypothetical protein [Dyadobacter psychrotolerans]|uniref:Uncharacterized protein n=1 Tax=Dyadobacter psychrotolerans TaxID=2541721 RepID=A0A4R5DUP2_9BACT|nr:hypothetical protein [Dyadobacter psychrotolerans]TDE14683.1 hypothetical protein E0F88_15970 [Dyadobacter psychrotolerans]
MKKTIIIVLISLSIISCGKESSPEGRFQLKAEALEIKLDSMQKQNDAILDTIHVINIRINNLEARKGK